MREAVYYSGHPDISSTGQAGYSSHIRGMIRGLKELDAQVSPVIYGDRPSGATTVAKRASSTRSAARRLARRSIPRFAWNGLRDGRLVGADRRGSEGLVEVLNSTSADFIYERHAHLHVGGLRVARDLGIRHVLEVNSPPNERARLRGWSPYDRVATRRTLRVIQETDVVLFVSSALREYYEDLIGSRLSHAAVVPNAVDAGSLEIFHNAPREDVADEITIGFVGSLMPWHGVDLLLEAFRSIARSHPQTRLMIVGDGERRRELEAESESLGLGAAVTFTGAVAHDDALSMIATFDIAVMVDSNWYGSPMKLFEYAGLGCAMLVPDVAPVREVFLSGVDALFVQPVVSDIAHNLERLVDDAELRTRLGASARNRVENGYTWRHAASTVLSFLDAQQNEPTR